MTKEIDLKIAAIYKAVKPENESPAAKVRRLANENRTLQTVPVQIIRTATEPAWSLITYPDLHYAQMHREIETAQEFDTVEAIPEFLAHVDERVSKENGIPERFMGVGYESWQNAKKLIAEKTGHGLSDYVLFDRNGEDQYGVEIKEGQAKIVRIGEDETNLKEGDDSAVEFPETADETEKELLILKLAESHGITPESHTLRRMSKIANDFKLERDLEFERNGMYTEKLEQQGATRLGEFQEIFRVLRNRQSAFTAEEGFAFDDDMMTVAQKITEEAGMNAGKEDIENALRQSIYFDMVTEYFREHPQRVYEFMKSGLYGELEESFEDKHLCAYGQTAFQKAVSMFANYYLYKYEGAASPEDSHSQVYMKDSPFLEKVGGFISSSSNGETLTLPVDPNSDEELRKLAETLHVNPRSGFTMEPDKRREKLYEACMTLPAVGFEKERHSTSLPYWRQFKDWTPFLHWVDSGEGTNKPFREFIGNFGLAKVTEVTDGIEYNRFTVSTWLPNTPYYPEGARLFPYDPEEAVTDNVMDAVRHILNGQTLGPEDGTLSPFESEIARMYTEGSVILDYLSQGDAVPENIREFVRTIRDADAFKTKVLERFGPLNDQDPQVVSQFYAGPDGGFAKFQIETTHRYVHDFVEGVRTQLIELTEGKYSYENVRRKIGNDWESQDFSGVDQDILQQAIRNTLKNAEHRIDRLNHVTKEMTSLKDLQEFGEIVFGWDTNDMKYLRWKDLMNIWNMQGGAWDCMCYSRIPIFNDTARQY